MVLGLGERSVNEGDDSFDVVVTGFAPGDEPPARRLERVFGIGPEAAERLLARVPAPVQRGVPRIRAEYFRRALLKIGAHVEVRDPRGAAIEALPSVPPPAPHRSAPRASHAAPAHPGADHGASHAVSHGASADTGASLAIAVSPHALSASSGALDIDGEAPLAPSLSPAALSASSAAPEPLRFDEPGAGPRFDAAPPAPAAVPAPAAPLGAHGATADTLIDARPRAAAAASPTIAGSAPQPARDTLADAVAMPAHPTLREGTAAAPAAPALPAMPALTPGFNPPPLELGLDGGGAGVMSRLPSSIWDAPASLGAAPAAAAATATAVRRPGGTLLDLPGESAASLEVGGPLPPLSSSRAVEAPLDLPSPRPMAGGDLSLPAPAPAKPAVRLPPAVRERPPRPEGAAHPARAVSTSAPPAAPRPRAPASFWEALPRALALPFSGTGGVWIGVIMLGALGAAALIALSAGLIALAALVALAAYTVVLALACDYFRACFRLAEGGAPALERAPSLAPARVLRTYLKSGAQLTVFALVTGLPLLFVAIARIGDGATPLDVLGRPSTWALGLLPALLWPGALAMTALQDRFEAIWQLPRVLVLTLRAPAEYLAAALLGALVFGAALWLALALASALGVTGVLLGAALGPPLALGHGVQGAVMGQLMRARPELFR